MSPYGLHTWIAVHLPTPGSETSLRLFPTTHSHSLHCVRINASFSLFLLLPVLKLTFSKKSSLINSAHSPSFIRWVARAMLIFTQCCFFFSMSSCRIISMCSLSSSLVWQLLGGRVHWLAFPIILGALERHHFLPVDHHPLSSSGLQAQGGSPSRRRVALPDDPGHKDSLC